MMTVTTITTNVVTTTNQRYYHNGTTTYQNIVSEMTYKAVSTGTLTLIFNQSCPRPHFRGDNPPVSGGHVSLSLSDVNCVCVGLNLK